MEEKKLADAIRKVGLKATTSRIQLLIYLQTSKYPQSILAIADGLKKEMDQVTVYRIVESFAKVGLIREVNLRKGSSEYEINDEHDHHHIVCTNCERVEDFTGCSVEKLAERALAQSSQFAQVNSHSLELFGLCKKCVV